MCTLSCLTNVYIGVMVYTMRQISVRSFRQNLASELENLPFELTKRNKIVAVVYAPGVGGGVHNPSVRKKKRGSVRKKKENVLTGEKPGASFNPVPKPEFKGKGIGYDKKKKKGGK